MSPSRPKVAFVVTESWYFLSHRQPLMRACREAGWDSVLLTRVRAADRDALTPYRVVPLGLDRASRNPMRELLSLIELIRILAREKPDIVHLVALKPVLYGALAAWLLGRDAVCALGGLGSLFVGGGGWRARLRRLVIAAMRMLLKRRRVRMILQNDDDRASLLDAGVIAPGQVTLIRGAGVDLDRFRPLPEPDGPPVFVLPARMLRDKGVADLVAAARLLRARGVACRVWLAGAPDPDNPTSLSPDELNAWQAEGLVEWLGHRADMPALWARAHVCVLPSFYREGVPKALLEAAACARPIITTDMPGCRDVVTPEIEGLLVPPRDPEALAQAMARLAGAPDLRRTMGAAARRRAEAEFGERGVMDRTMALYRAILSQNGCHG